MPDRESKYGPIDDYKPALALLTFGVAYAGLMVSCGVAVNWVESSKRERINNQQEYKVSKGSEQNSLLVDFNPLARQSTVDSVTEEMLKECEVLGTIKLEGNDLLVIVKDPGCDKAIDVTPPAPY